MTRREYRVDMKDDKTGRKSFTLVNAEDEDEAKRGAEKHHGPGNTSGNRAHTITGARETGR